MTTKIRSENRDDPATPRLSNQLNRIPFGSRLRTWIVFAACWGFLPINVADWIIRGLNLGNSDDR